MMTGLLIGMLTGITVWWFLVQRLKAKPWTEVGVIPASQDNLTSSAPKVGLWVFLGMVSSLFLIFTGAYFMRKDHGHGGGMEPWVSVDEPNVLWLNTLVLILASFAMHRARAAATRYDAVALRKYSVGAGLLSVVFLVGQYAALRSLAATGLYTAATPAYAFFVLLTTIHAVHLLGGLWVLGRAGVRIFRGFDKSDLVVADRLRLSVELCTTYWHFLLVVWLGLFWLLLST